MPHSKSGSSRTENDVVKAIREVLDLYGIPNARINSGAVAGAYKGKRRFVRFNSCPGMSDIVGILPGGGQVIAIEAKMPGRNPTDDQVAFMDQIRDNGGIAFVARSVDDVMEHLIEPYITNTPESC